MTNSLAAKLKRSEAVGDVEMAEPEAQGPACLETIHKEPKVPSMRSGVEEDHKVSVYSSSGRTEETTGRWRTVGWMLSDKR